MKTTGKRRIFCLFLACLLVSGVAAMPVSAASSSVTLPDLSNFMGSDYTQNVIGTYTHYVTCIYDKSYGYDVLKAFLELLQEDRYQLEYTGSKEYIDTYSSNASCVDYFFRYTGTSGNVSQITTKSGDSYHVKLTLMEHIGVDWYALVLYSHPNFELEDSGVVYDWEKGKADTPAPTTPKPTVPKETSPAAPSGADCTVYVGGTAEISCHRVFHPNYETFSWEIVEGSANIELSHTERATCTIQGIRAGTAVVKVTYRYGIDGPDVLTGIIHNQAKKRTYTFTIAVVNR